MLYFVALHGAGPTKLVGRRDSARFGKRWSWRASLDDEMVEKWRSR